MHFKETFTPSQLKLGTTYQTQGFRDLRAKFRNGCCSRDDVALVTMAASCFLVVIILGITHGQLDFNQQNGFQLTVTKTSIEVGDDVTFTCTKSTSSNDANPARSLIFSENKGNGITWERNGQSLFSTSREGNVCHVRPEKLLGRPAVTQEELSSVTCQEDDVAVRVTIRNVTVTPSGDRWVCSRFPFQQSNAVSLYNFVPVKTVTLTVEDHFPNDVTSGILMTLTCRASPCNPAPSVTWKFMRDVTPIATPQQSRSQSSIDDFGNVILVSQLAIAADPRYDNATVTCLASNVDDSWVISEKVTITTQRAPRILISANPSNEVKEGTDVTLTCRAHGHPGPQVQWQRRGGSFPGGLLVSPSPSISLRPAKAADQGEYVCTAVNGVQPDAVNSLYLKVEELPRMVYMSSMAFVPPASIINDTVPDVVTKTPMPNSHNHDDDKGNADDKKDMASSNSDHGGTIAAVVISVLVLLAAGGFALVWLLNKRKKQNYVSGTGPRHSLFPPHPHGSVAAPGPGHYAARSSLRPTTRGSLDSMPQYLELPPAPGRPGGVLNQGYGISPETPVCSERPLPAAPRLDDSAYTGYDEILDVVTPDRMVTADGYEIPVLSEEAEKKEEEGEEVIYDVARPEPEEAKHSTGTKPTYMNHDTFSTHM